MYQILTNTAAYTSEAQIAIGEADAIETLLKELRETGAESVGFMPNLSTIVDDARRALKRTRYFEIDLGDATHSIELVA
jgi:hypothetical protein